MAVLRPSPRLEQKMLHKGFCRQLNWVEGLSLKGLYSGLNGNLAGVLPCGMGAGSSISQAYLAKKKPLQLKASSLVRSSSWTHDSTQFLERTAFFSIKERIQCTFEGFLSLEGCRHEDFRQQKGDSAIVGLHSNWITPQILAMARPSDVMIKNHLIVYQFEINGIGAIFNLQEPGEHAECGSGIKMHSGFSYTPEVFMHSGIYYYNFPWRDMTCPSVEFTLNIIHVMDAQLSKGRKVAVHCHSGLGEMKACAIISKPVTSTSLAYDIFTIRPIISRTGLVIACYLVYRGEHTALSAVQRVRRHRPGSLQTKQQVLHVKEFEDHLVGLRVVFVQPWQCLDGFGKHATLELLMSRQRKLLHGDEGRALRYTPKVLVWVIRETLRRLREDEGNKEKLRAAFSQGLASEFKTDKDMTIFQLVNAVKQKLNAGNWNGVELLDVQVLVQLLLDWLHLLQEPVVPDLVLTSVLGRGDLNAAIDELKTGGKCSFFTIQMLACWMFQIVPAEKNPRSRLFSGLAHILLHSSNLQHIKVSDRFSNYYSESSSEEHLRRHVVRRQSNYRPSALELEYGLFLEAAAKYWCRNEKNTIYIESNIASPSSASQTSNSQQEEPWLNDRASLMSETPTLMEMEDSLSPASNANDSLH